MSSYHLGLLLRLPHVAPLNDHLTFRVAVVICDGSNADGELHWSADRLAATVGVCSSSLRKHRDRLRDAGLMSISPTAFHGRSGWNVITLNLDVLKGAAAAAPSPAVAAAPSLPEKRSSSSSREVDEKKMTPPQTPQTRANDASPEWLRIAHDLIPADPTLDAGLVEWADGFEDDLLVATARDLISKYNPKLAGSDVRGTFRQWVLRAQERREQEMKRGARHLGPRTMSAVDYLRQQVEEYPAEELAPTEEPAPQAVEAVRGSYIGRKAALANEMYPHMLALSDNEMMMVEATYELECRGEVGQAPVVEASYSPDPLTSLDPSPSHADGALVGAA